MSFSPYVYLGACKRFRMQSTTDRGLYNHEVLFHELVHALRHVTPLVGPRQPLSGGLKWYENTEEFIAVMVTNIFMTDPSKKWGDRQACGRDHHHFGKLSKELSGSLEFFKISSVAFDRIEQFCLEHQWFTERLAKIKATFNPIAAYYHEPAKAEQFESFDAAIRDYFVPKAAPKD